MDLWMPILLTTGSLLAGEDARGYLDRAAKTYKRLHSFQAETIVERTSSTADSSLKATFTLYVSMPDKLRIESKDGDGNLRLLLISADKRATEFRAWKNEYAHFSASQQPD